MAMHTYTQCFETQFSQSTRHFNLSQILISSSRELAIGCKDNTGNFLNRVDVLKYIISFMKETWLRARLGMAGRGEDEGWEEKIFQQEEILQVQEFRDFVIIHKNENQHLYR